MRTIPTTLLLMILYIGGVATSAPAQNAAQDCDHAPKSKDVVAGCTRLIDSGTGSSRQRAQMFYRRAQAYAALERLNPALEDYNRALGLDPDRVEIYLDRADLQLWQKDFAAAKRDYDRVLSMTAQALGSTPSGVQEKDKVAHNAVLLMLKGNAYFGLGLLSRRQGDRDRANDGFDNAVKVYSTVIERTPANYDAFHQRARVQQLQYRYAQAKADDERAANLLEREITQISEPSTIKEVKKVVKEWRTAAAYSGTMAELDKRFEHYLKDLEENKNFPNWSQPPWTTFRRVHLHEKLTPLRTALDPPSFQHTSPIQTQSTLRRSSSATSILGGGRVDRGHYVRPVARQARKHT